ncbi:hypothetical protein [Rhodopirellula bahusiensis]|uniref:Uncharacterized protein n=1 Tax=Rhodopirellula bahusiensis TaxID=2014065 RepID=A0A2G1W723_9BACT|nr:hypothetical protein [Rhodopirellula bahusiensis]PHQ34806.1 hypothetical protein CEE69_13105 [Rhodopirellula bahusiensis]
MYLSNTESIFEQKFQISENESAEIEKLAADTFAAFHPYINIRDCGKKLWDEEQGAFIPKHMITKEAFRFGTIYDNLSKTQRKAYKPIFTEGKRKGKPFHYWAHYRRGIMSSEKMAEHIQGEEKYYYTGSPRHRALPYLDIDAHNGETDELRAKELLADICSTSLWTPSDRGQNGHFKLYYGPIRTPDLSHPHFQSLPKTERSALIERIRVGLSPKQVNGLFKRAQTAYSRYLAFHRIECDFEVKGHVTEYSHPTGSMKIVSGLLGKFPFAVWNRQRLEEFKSLPEISWFVWERQIQLLEKMLEEKEDKTKINETATDQVAAEQSGKPKSRAKNERSPDPETCAFTKNRLECLSFVRSYYRDHKSIPSHDDFLTHLKINRLYTGDWDDPQTDRPHRTARILDFTLQNFDPEKLGRGEGRWGNFPVLDWLRDYAKHNFGGLTGTVLKYKDKLIFCDDGTIESGRHCQRCNVSPAFVHHCIRVVLTCMEDLAENDGLPEDRIVKAWNLLSGAPAWNRDHYAIVRNFLEDRGVVDIYDKNHGPNKCWRWRKGRNYPTSPEELQRKLKKCRGIDLGYLFPRETMNSNKDKITPYCKVIETNPPMTAGEDVFEHPPP